MPDRFNTPAPLLDVLASFARTALDDPASLPGLDYERPGVALAYAIDKLDTIINTLNPSEESREAYAETLTMLGRHLAERQDTIERDELTYQEHDTATKIAYMNARVHLGLALDALDEAINALTPEPAWDGFPHVGSDDGPSKFIGDDRRGER